MSRRGGVCEALANRTVDLIVPGPGCTSRGARSGGESGEARWEIMRRGSLRGARAPVGAAVDIPPTKKSVTVSYGHLLSGRKGRVKQSMVALQLDTPTRYPPRPRFRSRRYHSYIVGYSAHRQLYGLRSVADSTVPPPATARLLAIEIQSPPRCQITRSMHLESLPCSLALQLRRDTHNNSHLQRKLMRTPQAPHSCDRVCLGLIEHPRRRHS